MVGQGSIDERECCGDGSIVKIEELGKRSRSGQDWGSYVGNFGDRQVI